MRWGKKKAKIIDPYVFMIDWNKVKTIDDITLIMKCLIPFNHIVVTEEDSIKYGIHHLIRKK